MNLSYFPASLQVVPFSSHKCKCFSATSTLTCLFLPSQQVCHCFDVFLHNLYFTFSSKLQTSRMVHWAWQANPMPSALHPKWVLVCVLLRAWEISGVLGHLHSCRRSGGNCWLPAMNQPSSGLCNFWGSEPGEQRSFCLSFSLQIFQIKSNKS